VDGTTSKGGQPVTASANSKKGDSGKIGEQRYFRVPFIRPNEQNRDANGANKKKGWWYAHFDGMIKYYLYLFIDKPGVYLYR
jgi:myosin-6